MKKPHVSREKIRWAREQYAAGMSIKEIAWELAVSYGTAWNILNRIGKYRYF